MASGGGGPRLLLLSRTVCRLDGFRKSTPPQNRLLFFFISDSKMSFRGPWRGNFCLVDYFPSEAQAF